MRAERLVTEAMQSEAARRRILALCRLKWIRYWSPPVQVMLELVQERGED